MEWRKDRENGRSWEPQWVRGSVRSKGRRIGLGKFGSFGTLRFGNFVGSFWAPLTLDSANNRLSLGDVFHDY
jgi:hypothetical protein